MLSHSGGRILGRPWIHSKIYRREEDFFACQDDGLVDASGNSFTDEAQAMTLKGMDSHYKKLYVLHQREVTEFFSKYAPHALFVGKLDDPNKWQKMAKFLEMDISEDYDSHENATHARTHARRNAQFIPATQ